MKLRLHINEANFRRAAVKEPRNKKIFFCLSCELTNTVWPLSFEASAEGTNSISWVLESKWRNLCLSSYRLTIPWIDSNTVVRVKCTDECACLSVICRYLLLYNDLSMFSKFKNICCDKPYLLTKRLKELSRYNRRGEVLWIRVPHATCMIHK